MVPNYSWTEEEVHDKIEKAVKELEIFKVEIRRSKIAPTKYDHCPIDNIYTSFLVLFTNLAFVFLFAMHFWNIEYFNLFILFYGVKFLVDLILLFPILKFFNRTDLVKWIFPFEIFYSFYIVLIVVLSFTKSFEWKGRVHSK